MKTNPSNRQLCALLIGLGAILAACSSEPPTPGTLTTLDAACDKANEGKRIAVEGYLKLPDSFKGDSSVLMRIKGTLNDNFPAKIATSISSAKDGKAPNTMNILPKSYSEDDLVVRASDGSVLKYDSKVRVSGKMYFP
jgi:uncharacterized Zn finger protein